MGWSPVPWNTVNEAGPNQRTPSLSSVVQEIVDRPGWSSGNALVFVITGTGERVAESYNGDRAGAPLLHVEFTFGAAMRVSGEPAGADGEATNLTLDVLDQFANHALTRWADAGADVDGLQGVELRVAELPNSYLALATENVIWVDDDAAGHGWFLDATPWDDVEYNALDDGVLQASTLEAGGGIDLLTVLAHEFGHVLGLGHDEDGGQADDVMDGVLEPGLRLLPTSADVDQLFSESSAVNGVLVEA